jgi:hypothetical protein
MGQIMVVDVKDEGDSKYSFQIPAEMTTGEALGIAADTETGFAVLEVDPEPPNVDLDVIRGLFDRP